MPYLRTLLNSYPTFRQFRYDVGAIQYNRRC